MHPAYRMKVKVLKKRVNLMRGEVEGLEDGNAAFEKFTCVAEGDDANEFAVGDVLLFVCGLIKGGAIESAYSKAGRSELLDESWIALLLASTA